MKKKTLIIIFMFVAGCGTVKDTEKSSNTLNQVSFEEGVYSVVVDRTELSWIGKEISTKIHTGTLNLSDGTIQIIDENTINGNITIDMSSINVTDLQGRAKEMLEGHLRSADFFEVENYPNATLNFKSKSYNKLKNLIDFEGQLTIKDISNPIFFSATLIESSPYLKAKSILSFDRSKYNVRFRSGSFFENLGDKLILDDIDVNIVLVTEKK
ncbi:MAG: lipid-binding protein [Candidatus Marinimicrobia bacterium]|nr:lipid-binding protein [Candidatus Neomarinimicrobiota bacterium]MBR99958.1 lipid-binding protein [Candidatus Neomarinimicrobiota bacterium]|tara:strand:+ start:41 stop:676 length:636 start_codon:yes stop_codon:yes gene_type:complete